MRCVCVLRERLWEKFGNAEKYDGGVLLDVVEDVLREEDVAVEELECETCGRVRSSSTRTGLPLFTHARSSGQGNRKVMKTWKR